MFHLKKCRSFCRCSIWTCEKYLNIKRGILFCSVLFCDRESYRRQVMEKIIEIKFNITKIKCGKHFTECWITIGNVLQWRQEEQIHIEKHICKNTTNYFFWREKQGEDTVLLPLSKKTQIQLLDHEHCLVFFCSVTVFKTISMWYKGCYP